MKHILYTICAGSMALAMAAQAAPDNDNNNAPRRSRAVARPAAPVQGGASTRVRTSGNMNTMRNRNFSARANADATMRSNRIRTSGNTNVSTRTNSERFRNRELNARNTNRFRNESNLNVNRERNITRNREVNRNANRNVTVNNREVNRNVNRNMTVNNREANRNINRNVTRNSNRNVAVTNNWRSDRFRGSQYSAFRNYRRSWHDRGWWDNHYRNHITFVFGSPYYWDSGFWYPAWGYYPTANYIYDGPIYGYGNLRPDQVVTNVQAQLQADGYYDGVVDGQLGPQTRQAIADFQADHGLAVTSAVDEPTLATLGLV